MGELMHRVLLVDDEPSVVKMIGKRLEFEGFEVLVAVDGEQAVAMARKEHPAVIILDLMLPKLSGFEVCEQLKQGNQAMDIPIITVFTGRGRLEDEDRCRKLGAAAYVTKGEGAGPLVKRIRALLKQTPSEG